MYIIDCGVNKSTIYDSENKTITKICHTDILDLPQKIPQGSLIVSEYAHLGCPRRNLSRSQPFTESQLLKLYDDLKTNKITLKLFPHQSTPRACNYSGLEKSDDNDPKSIWLLLNDFPQISLMNPPKSFDLSEKRTNGFRIKQQVNDILNFARRYEYLDESDQNTIFISKYIGEIAEKLSNNTKSVFGLTEKSKYKRGEHKGSYNLNSINLPQIYSILATLQTPEGDIIKLDNGNIPGWRFISRYVLCMSPFHLKGGVARSNLYYHGLRNWVAKMAADELGLTRKQFIKKRRGGYRDDDGNLVNRFTSAEDSCYLKYRRIYCKAIKELFYEFRKILVENNTVC